MSHTSSHLCCCCCCCCCCCRCCWSVLTVGKMSPVRQWLVIYTLSLSHSVSVSLLTSTLSPLTQQPSPTEHVTSCCCRNSTCRANCCLSRSIMLSFASKSNFYTYIHIRPSIVLTCTLSTSLSHHHTYTHIRPSIVLTCTLSTSLSHHYTYIHTSDRQ